MGLNTNGTYLQHSIYQELGWWTICRPANAVYPQYLVLNPFQNNPSQNVRLTLLNKQRCWKD